jgi:hypothetical protein
MNRIRAADTAATEASGDIFAPESSLLTIDLRRPQGALQREAHPLHAAWHTAFDLVTGTADDAVLKAAMGHAWSEAILLERPGASLGFTIRPIGRLPADIRQLLADGHGLPALMEQINHMAMVNCHSVKPAGGIVELDDGDAVTGIRLTLLPLASREGVVHRYLGTLGQ